jgi:hydroxymethylbilane synthase
MKLRIATRKSPLALWQAEHVAALVRAQLGADTELVSMTTTGDQLAGASLAKVGGKGLFLKELERALEEGRADLAVHSMKDVPVRLAAQFAIAAVLERADPRDAFVSSRHSRFEDLPAGARVGTSSLRRQCQIKALRPDVEVVPIRGNVETRLRKLDEGQYDALVLAIAGLERLGLAERVREGLPPEVSLPAIGQGAIGIECRSADATMRARLGALEHAATRICVNAERALNEGLGGSCVAPIAGFAEITGTELALRGLVGDPQGRRILRGRRAGPVAEARAIGLALARELEAQGANELLAAAGTQA